MFRPPSSALTPGPGPGAALDVSCLAVSCSAVQVISSGNNLYPNRGAMRRNSTFGLIPGLMSSK